MAPPTPSSPRESRRSSKSGSGDAYSKPKPHSHHQRHSENSGQQDGRHSKPASERPRLTTRTYSAPLVNQAVVGTRTPHVVSQYANHDTDPHKLAHYRAFNGSAEDGQDEDEVAGVVGPVKRFQPFQTFEVSDSLPEINIAVLGAKGVGKSTFMQRALGLSHPPSSHAAERKIPIDGRIHMVRLLELSIDDVDIDDDDVVEWPETIANKMMPTIDGTLILYNVNDKSSLEAVPDMLSAVDKASLPSVLISCKCDTPLNHRQIDYTAIEQQAKRKIPTLRTLQTSETSPDSYSQAISLILRTIVAHSSARRRAQSNASRPASPKTTSLSGHSRASSEYTGTMVKDQKHSRHDSSLASYSSTDRLRAHRELVQDDMKGSFLLEESASECSSRSGRSSISVDLAQRSPATTSVSFTSFENSVSFNDLVTRLLAQPTSKSDVKFSAIFLALYRKFAAPGRLLEAIVERYDAAEQDGTAEMLTTVTQLRYLSILEMWIGSYPGDFAHPKTKRRMRTFISKISSRDMYAVAAKEMTQHLDVAQEDDDTNWAYSDKNREAANVRSSMSSTASAWLDDPSFSFGEGIDGIKLDDDKSDTTQPSCASTSSSQIIASVEYAQKQSQLLQPVPRLDITKIQWRNLMDQPDDRVARELTRIDWIMFSSVRPRDMVRHVSLSREEKLKCKNVVHVSRMVEHFNQLASWVANFILLRDKPKHRALMLEKFMRVARKLRDMNNYNALGAIIAGVNSSAIHRLNATRELIPPNVGKDWMKYEILMAPSKSHAAYRLAWENSSTERIPYLPLHCRDLVSAQDGNKTFIGDESEGKINWKKFEVMGDVILSIQRAQGTPYTGLGGSRGDPQIKELVLDVKLEKDEDILYERSIQVEPAAQASGGGPSQKFKEFFKR
ncbi:Hypothetical protein R9X50_00628100 [Acrodontium crateriforme]|uniref:Ras GEF n=1 Tax=Acrodontium crateriforme TaxID=150365 RepID=A0AAQ3MBA1_9PEZI|nr:Hypothetical protein R9X50_00628100 [Acrodontium crateriforme]